MNYKKKYKDAIERCKKEFNFNNLAYSHEEIRERLEHVFPELKETNDKIIRKELIKLMKQMSNTIVENYTTIEISTFVAWLEKQDKKDSKVFPTFTFDDIVALQCCMKKVQKDEELYNQIQTLHDRLHDAYWLEKQDEQKETLCDKCRKAQPSHSCQDITALGRCAVEHEQNPTDKAEPKFHAGDFITDGKRIFQIKETV